MAVEPDRGYGRAGRIAVGVTVVGWFAHLATIVTRGFAADRVPWGNMYEFSTAVAFIVVCAFLGLLASQRSAGSAFSSCCRSCCTSASPGPSSTSRPARWCRR